jgi:transposase
MLPLSNDTLLRVVRRHGIPPPPPPTVIGIDDRAWRRNHRCGTIICDLGRRRPNSLLADRQAPIAEARLADQTEGQTTRLNLVKCQMYDRGKLDLREARPIGAS